MADDRRRALPSVDTLLQAPDVRLLLDEAPRHLVVAAAREAIARVRRGRSGPPPSWALEIADLVRERRATSLQPVLNATGVVLHTNLGRAPLATAAIAAVTAVASGYSALEFDLATGERGDRADHARRPLAECTGAADGFAVNNAAGALVVALAALAGGREVLISRGELIEIGGSFRIPDIIAQSGTRLREVGTTNRTHLADYAGALGPDTGAILTVHRSNFAQRGFVATPDPADLAALAAAHAVPYVHDVGSGLLADLAPWGLTGEPLVRDAVRAGAGLVLFSGDKLLGGPQAGCLVGTAPLVAACRRHPLARAMRADKLTLAALEATLALYADLDAARREIPVLRMLTLEAATLQARADALAALLRPLLPAVTTPGSSAVGGGAFADAELPTTLVALDPGPLGAGALAVRLRLGTPAVVTRVQDGRVLLDPRTLPADADAQVAGALERALARS